MKRLLKSEKGMSLLEVIIAVAILGVLAIPIMTTFLNTQIYAKKVDRQTEVNAITRTVKQIVLDGMLSKDIMIDKDGNPVNQFDSDILHPDTFVSLIQYSKDNGEAETPFLQFTDGWPPVENTKYTYKIRYKHSDFYNPDYLEVYNFEITIYDKGSSQVVNKIKIAINLSGI